MKEIITKKGKTTLVDDEDFEEISKHSWNVDNEGYAYRSTSKGGARKIRLLHHMIIGRPKSGLETDHIDGNRLNNQKNNLRFVTHRQNMQNQHRKKRSIYPGVTWYKANERWGTKEGWVARIRIGNRHLCLTGKCQTEKEAFDAYCTALKAVGESLVRTP